MKTTVTETHAREIYAYLDRHELLRLVGRHVADPHGVNVDAAGTTLKIDFEEETEGSPSYRVGMAAKVRITVKLGDGQ